MTASSAKRRTTILSATIGRAAGTPGCHDSAPYAGSVLESAGFDITLQHFSFVQWQQLSPSTFVGLALSAVTYVEVVEYQLMEYSRSGGITAPLTPLNVQISSPGGATSGRNAAAAGASAVVIFNEATPQTVAASSAEPPAGQSASQWRTQP